MALRDLIIRLAIQNADVAQRVEALKENVKTVNGMTARASIDVNTSKAVASLNQLKLQIHDLDKSCLKLQANSTIMSSAFSSLSSIGHAATSKLAAGFGLVNSAMASVAAQSSAVTAHIKKNWNDIESDIKKVAAVSTGFSIGSIYMAAGVQANLETIKGTRGEEAAAAYAPWIKQGRKLRYTDESTRGQLAETAAKYLRGTSTEDQIQFLTLLEKEGARERASPEALGNVMESLATGRLSTIKRELPGMGIDVDAIQARAEKQMENPFFMRAHPGMTKEDVVSQEFVKEFTKWGQETEIPGVGKTLQDINVDLEPIDKFKSEIKDISTTLGDSLKPALFAVNNVLEAFNEFLQNVPGAGPVIAISIGFAAIASTGIIMAAALLSASTALGISSVAAGVASVAIGGLRLAMTLLAAHPIIAVLLILATILIYVATRTDLLQKAWEKLQGIKVGEIIGGGIAFAVALWEKGVKLAMSLWDILMNLGKMGGIKLPLALALGPLGLVFGIALPLVIKLLTSMVNWGELSTNVLKFIQQILEDLLNVFEPVSNFIKKIYDMFVWLSETLGITKPPEPGVTRGGKSVEMPLAGGGEFKPSNILGGAGNYYIKDLLEELGYFSDIPEALLAMARNGITPIYDSAEQPGGVVAPGATEPEKEPEKTSKKYDPNLWYKTDAGDLITGTIATELAARFGVDYEGPFTKEGHPVGQTKAAPIGNVLKDIKSVIEPTPKDIKPIIDEKPFVPPPKQEDIVEEYDPKYDQTLWTSGGQEGATITRTGKMLVHGPVEEVVPMAETIKGPGAVARALRDLDLFQRSRPFLEGDQKQPGQVISVNFNSPLIGEATIASQFDLEDLMWQLQGKIADKILRELGYLRG